MTLFKRILYLTIGLLLGGVITLSHAAPVAYKFNGLNVVRVNGQTHLAGTQPAAAAGSTPWYVGNNAISAQGSAIANGLNNTVFSSVTPLAAGAASVAATALKLNPAGLVTSAVLAYALSQGLEYINGQFQVKVVDPTVPDGGTVAAASHASGTETIPAIKGHRGPGPAGAVIYDTFGQACDATRTYPYGVLPKGTCTDAPSANAWNNGGTSGLCYYNNSGSNCAGMTAATPIMAWKCPTGYTGSTAGYCVNTQTTYSCPDQTWTLSGNQCTKPLSCSADKQLIGGQCLPLTTKTLDQAWEDMAAQQWPNEAIRDMVRNGVPLPTDQTTFTPDHQDVPLSDPYIDPVTGNRYRDVARVTPSPSNPDTADVQVVKQQVDQNGQPVVDQGTGAPVPPEKETDWCKLNPDASGCKPLDEVPDVDLPENTITLSISPISGFGPDDGSCPAPRSLFTKGGQPVVWSWQQYCDFASGIRPLIVGFAWIAALMIVIGVARRNS